MQKRNNLKAAIVKKFWEVKAFSEKSGIPQSTMSSILNGRLYPTKPEEKTIARTLKIKIKHLQELL